MSKNIDEHYKKVLHEVIRGFEATFFSALDRIELLKKMNAPKPKRIVPPPRDVQIKELVQNLDERLISIENQVSAVMNHKPQPQSGVVVIFKGKGKPGGENGK